MEREIAAAHRQADAVAGLQAHGVQAVGQLGGVQGQLGARDRLGADGLVIKIVGGVEALRQRLDGRERDAALHEGALGGLHQGRDTGQLQGEPAGPG